MPSEYVGYTTLQLWEQLSRQEALARGLAHRIAAEKLSRERLIALLGWLQEVADHAVSLCEELERRGENPLNHTVISGRVRA